MSMNVGDAHVDRPAATEWSDVFGIPANDVITLRAKHSGAVYCNRSCLFVAGGRAGGVCCHDNSKLRASIFTKLGL